MTEPLPLVRQLIAERKAKNLSQMDIAEMSGYSWSHLSKAECGQRHPGLHALTAWAETLGFEVVLQRKEEK